MAGRMGAVRSLFTSFLLCHGRMGVNVPEGHGAEDYAVICVTGQGRKLNGERDQPVDVAGSPRLLLLGGALFPAHCPGAQGQAQKFLVLSAVQGR